MRRGMEISCAGFEHIPPESIESVVVYALTAGNYEVAGADFFDQCYADLWGTALRKRVYRLAGENVQKACLERLLWPRIFWNGCFLNSIISPLLRTVRQSGCVHRCACDLTAEELHGAVSSMSINDINHVIGMQILLWKQARVQALQRSSNTTFLIPIFYMGG